MDDNKGKALAAALAQIEKQFGKGSIMKMGESQIQNDLQVVSTGSLGLDALAGEAAARPRRRNLRARVLGQDHPLPASRRAGAKAGGTAAYIDAENALDPVYAGKLGVDVSSLLISQPDTGEQGLEIADMLVRSGGIDIIVIDSVAALVPRRKSKARWATSSPACRRD
jgi:recombination protein RecA